MNIRKLQRRKTKTIRINCGSICFIEKNPKGCLLERKKLTLLSHWTGTVVLPQKKSYTKSRSVPTNTVT